MSIIDCDYLPTPEPVKIPPELALMIIRKAAAMTEKFEERCLDQLTRDTRRALEQGAEPRTIIRQLDL